MQQRHEIEALLDGVVIADLLVAAVALVHRIVEHSHLEGDFRMAANPDPFGERRILGTVVDDQDFNIVRVEQVRGDATHHFLDGTLGEIGDDENKKARLRYVQRSPRSG